MGTKKTNIQKVNFQIFKVYKGNIDTSTQFYHLPYYNDFNTLTPSESGFFFFDVIKNHYLRFPDINKKSYYWQYTIGDWEGYSNILDSLLLKYTDKAFREADYLNEKKLMDEEDRRINAQFDSVIIEMEKEHKKEINEHKK